MHVILLKEQISPDHTLHVCTNREIAITVPCVVKESATGISKAVRKITEYG